MKRFLNAVPLLIIAGLAVALVYVGRPGAQSTDAVSDKPDSAEIARTDSLDASTTLDSLTPVDSLPEKLRPLKPVYPPSARAAGLEGDVWVKALISRNGNVLKATILKREGGNADMETSALTAAKQVTYRPAFVKGQPAALWVTYIVKYRLSDKAAHDKKTPPKN